MFAHNEANALTDFDFENTPKCPTALVTGVKHVYRHIRSRSALGFCSDPRPEKDGYTYTLTTIFGDFLLEAERRFGPRDKNWTILGIEFGSDKPKIWFPGQSRNVAIMLSRKAEREPKRAMHQLARETIHCLSPKINKVATNLEEGLAEFFAQEMAHRHQLHKRANTKANIDAREAVAPMLKAHPDAIRLARKEQPQLSAISADLLRKHAPSTSRDLISYLCQAFDSANI